MDDGMLVTKRQTTVQDTSTPVVGTTPPTMPPGLIGPQVRSNPSVRGGTIDRLNLSGIRAVALFRLFLLLVVAVGGGEGWLAPTALGGAGMLRASSVGGVAALRRTGRALGLLGEH